MENPYDPEIEALGNISLELSNVISWKVKYVENIPVVTRNKRCWFNPRFEIFNQCMGSEHSQHYMKFEKLPILNDNYVQGSWLHVSIILTDWWFNSVLWDLDVRPASASWPDFHITVITRNNFYIFTRILISTENIIRSLLYCYN